MTNKKRALGRGLDAILQRQDTDITSKDISGNYVVGDIASLALSKIEPNPFQPRTDFDLSALNELARSIKEQGIIQPVTVRKMGFDQYQLISGERRFRAASIAGLTEIPCYIRVANDEQMLEMALIENIHRKDLNAIEIAISYQRLIDECELTQEQLSERVGKNRSTVTNYLRLLKLPAEVQIALRDDTITMGHARAIITIEDKSQQIALLNEIIDRQLSVREIEKKVRETGTYEPRPKPGEKPMLPERYSEAGKLLSHQFGTPVKVSLNNKGKGTIVLTFDSESEFESLMVKLER